MAEGELIELLAAGLCADFADERARQVLDADAVGQLYALVASGTRGLPHNVRHKVLFRGAYVLERIFFVARERFMPHAEAFCRTDFAACVDASSRRHFAKIMSLLLRDYMPSGESLETIAATAAEWAVDPKARVAVRIWSVEVLKCCREQVGWVAESWDDILGAMETDATPGILCRMRKSWKITR